MVALSQRCWRWSRRRVFDFAGNVGVGLLGFVFEDVAEAVGLGGRAEQNLEQFRWNAAGSKGRFARRAAADDTPPQNQLVQVLT